VFQIIKIRRLTAQIFLQFHAKYKFKSRSDNAPHIFTVADQAYQDMLHHKESQHILLAGETLSGKTTNMLHLLQHLLYLGQVTAHCRLRCTNVTEQSRYQQANSRYASKKAPCIL
jgi:myosin heavy subunit